jgi:hypothetical protein
MGSLIGGAKGVSNTAPVISSIQLQTSSFGRAVPWIFGRMRVAPNLVQYEDFTSIPHTTTQKTGKGGGGGSSNTDYTYSVAAVMALASGTIASIGTVWRDKEVTTLAAAKLDFYSGAPNQTAYPYLISKHPDRALSYRGLSYVASGAYDLGSTAALGNHTFEVQASGSIAATYAGATVPDAEPVDVISAILTDLEQGVGLDPSAVGDLSAFRQFCLASGLWVSPAYSEQKSAYEYIKTLLMIGFADCVYSAGKFKVVPYSDVAVSSALGNYVPTIAPVADLGEDDLIDGGSSVIKITQKSAQDCFNSVRIKFRDRANAYDPNMAGSTDDADIEQNGARPMDVIDMPEIADAAVAQKVADFLLHRALYVLNTYEFRLPWSYIRLEPMDVVTLTYPRQYLDHAPVLITSIEEDDDGLLTIMAEDYPIGSNRAGLQAVPDISSTAPNSATVPGNAVAPILFEPPGQLTGGVPQLWLATAGGPLWGGAVVWVSTDNRSYQRVGTIRSSAQMGVLSAALAGGAAIDSTGVLAVDLTRSNGQLSNVTEDNARDLLTACYVDGEYIAYAHAALTGPSAYSLTYLVRGAFGGAPGAHPVGAPFVFLDNAIFRYAYPREWVGKTVWIKLTSFNRFGNGLQDISTVPAYQHTIAGAPVSVVQYLNATAKVFAITLDWGVPAASADYLGYAELWYSATPDRASATKLGAFASPQTSFTITGLHAGDTFFFWVRLIDQMGNVGPYFPSGAGVQGASSKDAKAILDWLAGQITATQLGGDLRQVVDLIGGLDAIRDGIGAANLTATLAAHNAALKESQARADAILIEATARGAAITTVQQTAQTAINSVAARVDTVSAANGTTAAAVQTEVTARTNAVFALASQVTTVAATTATNTAAITAETTARTDANAATATQITALSSRTAATEGAITAEQITRASSDSALGQRIDTVVAAVGTAAAAVQTEQFARASSDSALGQRIDNVQAVANGASAVAATTSTALVGTNGKLSALTTIKTQVTTGGRTYLAGIGVGVEANGPVVESQILLSAQRVAIINETDGGLTSPFAVQNGQVFISSAFIANASITTAKIGNLAVDTLQLAGSAVTVPLYVGGVGGASNLVNGQSVVVGSISGSFNDFANVVAIVSWQAVTAGAATNTTVSVTANGQNVLTAADSAPANLSTSHVATGRIYLAPGSYTFAVSFGNNYPSGSYNLGNWSITILGVKR